MLEKIRRALFGPKVYRMKAETGRYNWDSGSPKVVISSPRTRPIHDTETQEEQRRARQRVEEDASLSILAASTQFNSYDAPSYDAPSPSDFSGGGGSFDGGGSSGDFGGGGDSSGGSGD